jgi:glyoxylase-like metal-dependent hydrolase (beta-lactamase superfamily II)
MGTQTVCIGGMRVDGAHDGRLTFDPTVQMPGMPVELLAAHGAIEGDRWVAPLTTYIIRAAGRTTIVDTGLGPALGRFEGETGWLPEELRRAELDPERVQTVILTHLHPDHIGWNFTERDGERRLTFPNARYVVTRAEWEHWRESPAGFIVRDALPLADTGQLDLVDDGAEPAPGVRLLATPGHTPGHVSVLLYDGGEGAVITGDALYNPAQLEQPQWSSASDHDKELSARSRASLADRIADEGLIVLGGHFPPPQGGRLLRVEQRRVFRPLRAADTS